MVFRAVKSVFYIYIGSEVMKNDNMASSSCTKFNVKLQLFTLVLIHIVIIFTLNIGAGLLDLQVNKSS